MLELLAAIKAAAAQHGFELTGFECYNENSLRFNVTNREAEKKQREEEMLMYSANKLASGSVVNALSKF